MIPLPRWIIDKGNNYYSIDFKVAIADGETLPIDLSKIPQFAKFFTDPPMEKGTIEFRRDGQAEELYFIPKEESKP